MDGDGSIPRHLSYFIAIIIIVSPFHLLELFAFENEIRETKRVSCFHKEQDAPRA